MASIALDRDGNLVVGYSVSSDAVYPSIRATGKLFNEPAGILTFPELEIATGLASQTVLGRWGDYCTMSVDPLDGLTFWFTLEYMETSGPVNWQTRICSFQLHKNLAFSSDTIIFETLEDCLEGIPLEVTNNSSYDIGLMSLDTSGSLGPAGWQVDGPEPLSPTTLAPGGSISLLIKVDLSAAASIPVIAYDNLSVITDYKNQSVILGLDEALISGHPCGRRDAGSIRIAPNSFSETTTIIVSALEGGDEVMLSIHDARGQRIRTLHSGNTGQSGTISCTWDGSDELNHRVAAGIYFVRLKINEGWGYSKLVLSEE